MTESISTDLTQSLQQIKNLHQNHSSTADIAYWTLRDAIRSGLIHPGERLLEVDIASALDMSRTPVREALHRLELERIIVKASRRGLIVPEISLSEIIEIFEIREVLEGLAARRAAQRMGSIELEAMRDLVDQIERAHEQGNFSLRSRASMQFHQMLRSGSKLPRLEEMLGLLVDTYRGSLTLYEFPPEREEAAVREHRAIYEAIAVHDMEKAEELSRQHARNAARAQIQARRLSEQ